MKITGFISLAILLGFQGQVQSSTFTNLVAASGGTASLTVRTGQLARIVSARLNGGGSGITLNPAGQLQLNILMAIAEFERAILRERATAGLRAAKANGVKLGRPETLTRHPPAVAEMLRQGLGGRAVARTLRLPLASAAKLVRQATNGAQSPQPTILAGSARLD